MLDTSELDALQRDILKAANTIDNRAAKVVKKGAVNIKRDWRANAAARGSRHARAYPFSISFDMKAKTEAEVGPEASASSQGFLGYVLEYGGVHSPPHNDGKRAADKELPAFEREMGKLGEKI